MRDTKIDFLRSSAIIMVLVDHSLLRYASSDFEKFVFSWINVFTRPSIALFCFISGYLFATQPSYEYLMKRLKRIFGPYMLFSLIAFFYQFDIKQGWAADNLFIKWVIKIVICDTMGIYYFVFVVAYIYILFFLILRCKYFVNHLGFVTLFLFIINILHASYYYDVLKLLGWSDSLFVERFYYWRFLAYWPFFFSFGVIFKQYNFNLNLKSFRIPCIILWIGIIVLYTGLIFYGVKGILGFNTVINTCFSVLTILLLMAFSPMFVLRASEYISKKSYFLYLSHIYFVYISFPYFKDIFSPTLAALASLTVSVVCPLVIYELIKMITKSDSTYILGA